LTYKDNEALKPSIVRDIEKALTKGFIDTTLEPTEKGLFNSKNIKNEYWANWWKVYGLGLIGSLEGGVFADILMIVDEIPEYATFIAYGMDYSNSGENNTNADPHSIQELWFADGRLYINKIFEGNCNVTNQEFINGNWCITLDDSYNDLYSILSYKCSMLNAQTEFGVGACIADSANGANTNKLRSLGLNVIGYREFIQQNNLDSYVKINAIKSLRSFDKICITSKSTNTLKQFEELQWAKDKEGNLLTEKIDWSSVHHAIDAVIYGSLAFSWL
jgi:hypothetical protein